MKIISPMDVEPMVNEVYPPEVEGKIFHRRVLSALEGGPASIDIDYNSYAGGVGGRMTYAYDRDEFCFTVAGHIRTESRGVIDDAVAGMFMWRPAGAATDAIEFKEDSITICAFGPARTDEWSHRLPNEEIGEWDGTGERRGPTFRHVSEVEAIPCPYAPREARIAYRSIFSAEKDSSMHMDIGHMTVSKGAVLQRQVSERDEVWWLQSGALELVADGKTRRMKPGDFLFRAAREVVEGCSFGEDSVVICYSAPPRP